MDNIESNSKEREKEIKERIISDSREIISNSLLEILVIFLLRENLNNPLFKSRLKTLLNTFVNNNIKAHKENLVHYYKSIPPEELNKLVPIDIHLDSYNIAMNSVIESYYTNLELNKNIITNIN